MVHSPKPILKRSSADHSHPSTHHAPLPSHSHHLSSPSSYPHHPHSHSYPSPHPHSAPSYPSSHPNPHSPPTKHHHPRPPSVHFPPSPSQLTRTFTAYSSSAYDRSPIVVAPNSCAMPERGCPGRTYFDEGASGGGRSPPKSKGRGICGARDYHPRALAFASANASGNANASTNVNSTGQQTMPNANANYLGVPALIPDLSSESDESDGFAGTSGGAPLSMSSSVTFGVHGLAISSYSSSSPYSSSSYPSSSPYSSSSSSSSSSAPPNSKNLAIVNMSTTIYPASSSPYSPTSPYGPSSSPSYPSSYPSSSYPYPSTSPADEALTFLPYPPSPPSSSPHSTSEAYDGYEHDDEGSSPSNKDKPARRRRSERERRHESSRDPDRIRSCSSSGTVGAGDGLVGAFGAMAVNSDDAEVSVSPKKRSSSRRRIQKVYEPPAFASSIVDDGCLGGF